jgi:hypothetical protein
MAVYHQMGHHSTNLVFEPELGSFRGAIVSPVNESQGQVENIIERARNERPDLELVFDPQLYFPTSNRGQLQTWSHFPKDVDTADLSSIRWWRGAVDAVAGVAETLMPDAVCSPAVVPKVFSGTDFYSKMVKVGDQLATRLADVDVLQTLLVGIDDLTVPSRADEIASIVSLSQNSRVFLVVCADVEPRRELADVEGLKGVMRLIHLLESGGQQVVVGFCSSDMALWKAAGATSCATGKFFNLRRFTRSRFDEPKAGGGQLPYWLEERLFAYLRQSDVVRVEQNGGFSDATLRNPFTDETQAAIASGDPWVALGWRQYMWWFADFETRARRKTVQAALKSADKVWREFDDADVLMEERQNDGFWVRSWRRAVVEFSQSPMPT